MTRLPTSRPAETVSAGGGAAGLVWAALDGDWKIAVVSAVGFVPSVVTLLVAHGGVRGVLRLLWGGR